MCGDLVLSLMTCGELQCRRAVVLFLNDMRGSVISDCSTYETAEKQKTVKRKMLPLTLFAAIWVAHYRHQGRHAWETRGERS